MAKTKISQYSSTAGSNTDIDNINIAEGCSPANVNNAIRGLMAQLKDFQSANPTYYTADSDALAVGAGGTGAITATTARTNLSAAKSGANSDITSLSGLTTALSVAQGGTGGNDASTARSNLSAASSGANSDITSLTGLTTALTVAQGGTGANSITSKGVVIGNGTSAVTTVAPSTSGNVLTSNGTDWVSSAPAGSITLLGTITTTSGTSASLGSLTLTDYKILTLVLNGVSANSTTNSSLSLATSNGAPFTSGLGTTSEGFYGQITIDLSNGIFWSNIFSTSNSSPTGNSSNTYVGLCGYSTASTSITIYTKGATLDAGSIKVYGIK